MKNKKLKTFLILIFIIIFAILVFFVTKRIMFNLISSRFLTVIGEFRRTGNYHLITVQRIQRDDGKLFVTETEKMAKGVKNYTKTEEKLLDENGNEILEPQVRVEFEDGYNDEAESQYLYYSGLNLIEENLKIKSISKGKYEDKDCYIVRAIDSSIITNDRNVEGSEEAVEVEELIYVDPETYLPYMIEYKGDSSSTRKLTFELIETGTVDKFPEIETQENESPEN